MSAQPRRYEPWDRSRSRCGSRRCRRCARRFRDRRGAGCARRARSRGRWTGRGIALASCESMYPRFAARKETRRWNHKRKYHVGLRPAHYNTMVTGATAELERERVGGLRRHRRQPSDFGTVGRSAIVSSGRATGRYRRDSPPHSLRYPTWIAQVLPPTTPLGTLKQTFAEIEATRVHRPGVLE
jgi:hypothetical protein